MSVLNRQFTIPVGNFLNFQLKFEKLKKTAKRLKCEIPNYEIIKYSIEVNKVESHIIEVSGVSPKFEGFEFLGTINFTEGGNLLKSVPGFEMPLVYSTAKPVCDHCGKLRGRKNTFLVKKGGNIWQVGRSCLRDFLGHISPEYIAMMSEWMLLEEKDDKNEKSVFSKNNFDISQKMFLAYVLASIQNKGWSPKGGTAQDAAFHIFGSEKEFKERGEVRYKVSEENLVRAEEQLKAISEITPKNSFENNIKIIGSRGLVGRKEFNLSAAICRYFINEEAWQKELAIKKEKQRIEKEARIEASENKVFVGKIGDRLELELTLIDKKNLGQSSFSYYCTVTNYLLVFLDKDGNNVVSMTSTGKNYIVGEKYLIKATLKEHKVFRDAKQTSVTRAKVISGKLADDDLEEVPQMT